MLVIGTAYMGTGDPIYDGAPCKKPKSGQFVSPDLEFRQRIFTECLVQRYIGSIAAARDQNSRKPRFVVAGIEGPPFASQEHLHPRGEVPRRMRLRLTDVAQISGAVAGRNVHAATQRDGEMGKIAADSLSLGQGLRCGSRCLSGSSDFGSAAFAPIRSEHRGLLTAESSCGTPTSFQNCRGGHWPVSL